MAGEKEPGADSCETGEEGGVQDRCCDSSRASSSFADLKSLEVAHWEGPAPPQPRWHTEAEAASEEHGGVADRRAAAAGSATEANTVEMQSVPGREARHDTTPVAAAAAAALSETKMELVQAVARDKAGTHGGDPEEVTAAGGQEGEGGEQERRLLGTIKALLAELERDLDAARVLLPECHRFRKVVGCVSQAVGPGMSAGPRQVRCTADVTFCHRRQDRSGYHGWSLARWSTQSLACYSILAHKLHTSVSIRRFGIYAERAPHYSVVWIGRSSGSGSKSPKQPSSPTLKPTRRGNNKHTLARKKDVRPYGHVLQCVFHLCPRPNFGVQAMDVTEALREATEYSRTLSSPEAFLVVMAELLADGFEVQRRVPHVGFCFVNWMLLVELDVVVRSSISCTPYSRKNKYQAPSANPSSPKFPQAFPRPIIPTGPYGDAWILHSAPELRCIRVARTVLSLHFLPILGRRGSNAAPLARDGP